MPQFIYTMKGLGKVHPPDTKVLEDIWLSFYFGAKIGVLGLNGAGKSSLLKVMAGEDHAFLGEAFPAEGISIGFLHQEPLEPRHRLGVQMIRGLVEQQQIGRPQEQPAQRDTPALAARKPRHLGIGWRQAQRVHRELQP